MSIEHIQFSRRQFMQVLGLFGVAVGGLPLTGLATPSMLQKRIPSSGEHIPVIGMGSSRTFDVDSDTEMRVQLASVLRAFFDHGGSVIDTSPMYGSSEQVLGDLLAKIRNK